MRAIVAVPVLRDATQARARRLDMPAVHTPEDRLSEATGLAEAIDLDVVEASIVQVTTPRPATLFGIGKVADLARAVETLDAGLVIVDHALTPVQQRNLEKELNAKVLDRTGLILEIFGRRARTREGSLQVELAHLSYQRSRLVRSWTHLERQRGGRGFLGGPGEAQIELDRRMIETRIEAIEDDLAKVARTRALHRAGRERASTPVIALVGYTNAGKSTLFNRLTGAGVLAEDQVFATLDPTMRTVKLASGRRVIFSDTVGFISDLPTGLVAAFRATLEDVIEADLILHVRDIAHAETAAQREDVEHVLSGLGIDIKSIDGNIVEVWNKIDRLTPDDRDGRLAETAFADRAPVGVSALTGEGLDRLIAAIEARLGDGDAVIEVDVPVGDGRTLAWLHAEADVLSRETNDDGASRVKVRIPAETRDRFIGRLRKAGVQI
ncbi:MAG: GTPase HflX [Hyphomicrobiaceae bacterium]|nr:GTPase HflX [Hyphomicrobiaceae bacterium]